MFDRKAYYQRTREKQIETTKQWRLKNSERFNERAAEYNRNQRRKTPLNTLLQSAKTRAKKKGIPFSITLSDLTMLENCPIFGTPLVYGSHGVHSDLSASIDRIIPSLGYVPGNVLIVSWRANRIKCDATLEELQKLVNFYEKYKLPSIS